MAKISFDDFIHQGPEIDFLRGQIEQRRLTHAIMISGDSGAGKRTLAGLIAKALVCRAPSDVPCGQCGDCVLAEAGEHPDITVVQKGLPLTAETAKGRSTIPIEDIREVIRRSSQYSFQSGNRVCIIAEAESMTPQAQNCLLKILEEPPQNNYFILTSCHPEQLLITVRSRCRSVRLIPWEYAYIKKALLDKGVDADTAEKAAKASKGSIGRAVSLAADKEYWVNREEIISAFFRNRKRSEILSLSGKWKEKKSESSMLFNVLEESIHSLLRYRLNPEEKGMIQTYPEEWRKFASSAPIDRFAALSDRIMEARKQVAFNVNYQAVIEQLMLVFTG